MSELISNLVQDAVDFVYTFGYLGLFVVVLLGNLHMPIPTQLSLPLAGFLIGQGRFSFVPVLAASTAGAVVGAVAHYLLGYWLGEERLHRLIKHIERFRIVSESDLDRVSELFDRHGGKAILTAHLIPSVGALISVPPGIKRMTIYGRFLLYTLIGTALWNVIFIALGWMLGSWWSLVESHMQFIKYALEAAAVVGIGWFVWHRWLSSLMPQEKSETELATEVFVDRLKELQPHIDREELYKAIISYVRSAVEVAESEAEDKE